MIAALFVETGGCYWNLEGVDPWDEARDARKYAGPHPVVAHPPCQRWGRFWHGSTRKPHQFLQGDDDGCFRAALTALCRFGGVLEHPADSHAWDRDHFDMLRPPRAGGWIEACCNDRIAEGVSLWTCCVYQGHYGHAAGKPTWLLAASAERPPDLIWGPCEQRIHPRALALHGYEKARRIGMLAMVGGKDKTRIRNATPPEFRDVLIDIALRCRAERLEQATGAAGGQPVLCEEVAPGPEGAPATRCREGRGMKVVSPEPHRAPAYRVAAHLARRGSFPAGLRAGGVPHTPRAADATDREPAHSSRLTAGCVSAQAS